MPSCRKNKKYRFNSSFKRVLLDLEFFCINAPSHLFRPILVSRKWGKYKLVVCVVVVTNTLQMFSYTWILEPTVDLVISCSIVTSCSINVLLSLWAPFLNFKCWSHLLTHARSATSSWAHSFTQACTGITQSNKIVSMWWSIHADNHCMLLFRVSHFCLWLYFYFSEFSKMSLLCAFTFMSDDFMFSTVTFTWFYLN